MPPKQHCFKISGDLIYEDDKSQDEFCIFIRAMDDNHAVMLVREPLSTHAPKGKAIIKGIEKKVE
jgi:hypothetical protein